MLLLEACVWLLDARARLRAPPEPPVPQPPTSAEDKKTDDSNAADAPADAPEGAAGSAARRDSCARGAFDAVFAPFRLLLSTPLLRQLTLHTLLINVLVSGVWYERADAVIAAFASDKERFSFFATLNFCVAALTLLVQSFCFSRVVGKLGTTRTLLAEPLALAAGLTVTIVQPGIASIALLDGLRKVVHYSLLKPTKESLYAALPTDVQYRAKPLLDTLIYRVGSVVGAAYFTCLLYTSDAADDM
eukprot:6698838-Prymnesium_polylepis.1